MQNACRRRNDKTATNVGSRRIGLRPQARLFLLATGFMGIDITMWSTTEWSGPLPLEMSTRGSSFAK